MTPARELSAAANGRMERGTEDEILRLENFLPGLGGVYMDGSSIVVFIPPEMSRKDALSKLALGATTLNIDPSIYQQMIRGQNIIFKPGKYPFSQLVSWVESGVGGILRLPGVVGVDANEGINRVTLLVNNSSVIPRVVAAVHATGIPENALDFEVVAPAVLASGLGSSWATTGGGIKVQNENSTNCSLGYNDTYQDIKGFWTQGIAQNMHLPQTMLGTFCFNRRTLMVPLVKS